MANLETGGLHRGSRRVFDLLANVRAELALVYRFEKAFDFVWLAAGLHLHAAVREILDPPNDIESLGDVAHRPTETNSLDATFEKNFN
jgi:hypothetical protein